MSIKYKTIQKAQLGVAGGGGKKFYASPVYQGEKTLEGLTKDIEKISTVSGADIRAVLYALVNVMQNSLSDGQIVRLGELVSIEGKAKEEEVTSAAVKSAKVLFTLGSDLKRCCKR
ncbi:DNA-binding protein [Riemerella anatipestifer]|nr:DNA-binding protein [Riemerella anatipestifer]MRM82353.1 DNA-binding protein [Riemerella anatipestifer]